MSRQGHPANRLTYLLRLLPTMLAACLFALNASALPGYSPGAPAGDEIEWHYTVRPADNLQDLGKQFLKASHSSADLVRYNQISNPESVRPGTTLKVPVDWLRHEPVPARAASVSGDTLIRRHRDSNYQKLQVNTTLHIGDEISTRDGSVLIRFADGSILRLAEQSILVFNRLTRFGKTGMADTRLRLQKGSLSTQVKPLVHEGSRYEINTPSAVAAVRGTAFRLKTDGNASQLEVTEGIVQFTSQHVSIPVNAGEASILDNNVTQANRILLPAAPVPLTLIDRTSELPIQLSWQPQTDAMQYRYEIFRESTLGDLIESDRIRDPMLTINHLDNGTYTVAMRAINRFGVEGFNHLLQLQVRMEAQPASPISPLHLASTDNDMPEFAWQYNGDSEVARVEVAADPAFSQIMATSEWSTDSNAIINRSLAPGLYYWRVVTQAGGNNQAYSVAYQMTVKGVLPVTRILSVSYDRDKATLFWKALDEARQYQVQIAEDPYFQNIVSSEIVDKNYLSIPLTRGKQYFARVRGVESSFYVSRFSPERALLVR